MIKETGGYGDSAIATLNAGAQANETLGIEGFYRVECRDKDGKLKWEESFPNLVNAVGKELMFDTLLRTTSPSTYTTVGPFLGLIGGATPTFGTGSDTGTSHAGWTEFANYTVGGSAVRGTAVFGAPSSAGSTPTNVTTCTATAITYTITGAGGTVSGCFLVTGSGAVSTINNTGGVLYSAGAFAVAKITTAGDTVAVTYSTTATS
jgi:hypothetical protein